MYGLQKYKFEYKIHRGIFVLWIWGLTDQFLKDHQLNKAEFGVTDESISVWISGPQDKNPSIVYDIMSFTLAIYTKY